MHQYCYKYILHISYYAGIMCNAFIAIRYVQNYASIIGGSLFTYTDVLDHDITLQKYCWRKY